MGFTSEAISFFQRFQFNFEKSISYRYTTILNESISQSNTREKRNELIRIKLDTVFVQGNEIEEDLLKNRFTTVTNDLASEMAPSFGIDQHLKDDFKELYTLNSIYNNLKVLINQRPSYYSLQLVLEFKTFILYLTDKSISDLKKHILSLSFLSNRIKGALISILNNQKEDKKIHNQDNNKNKNL